jgi:hypothetical protein
VETINVFEQIKTALKSAVGAFELLEKNFASTSASTSALGFINFINELINLKK